MSTFTALLAIFAGNSPVPGEFLAQRPVTRNFDVFFDLRLNKPLSKQWWGWWFETLSRPFWRHCNEQQQHKSLMPLHSTTCHVIFKERVLAITATSPYYFPIQMLCWSLLFSKQWYVILHVVSKLQEYAFSFLSWSFGPFLPSGIR